MAETNDKMLLAELVGGLCASGFSFLLAMYAQPKVTSTDAELPGPDEVSSAVAAWNPTMRTASAVTQIGACLLILICSILMFNEIPHSERQQYRRVKQKLKQLTKQRELVAREVQDHALACYEEWNRMKDSEPNAADVRATLQLNFTMSLMYSLPVTLVGLQIVVLEADFTDISTCFLLAALVSLLGGAVRVLKI